jgi:hypothetical protein
MVEARAVLPDEFTKVVRIILDHLRDRNLPVAPRPVARRLMLQTPFHPQEIFQALGSNREAAGLKDRRAPPTMTQIFNRIVLIARLCTKPSR